jgi:trimethylamine--corrinoid protein Co-methyltransferase
MTTSTGGVALAPSNAGDNRGGCPRLRALTEEQKALLHDASLEILQRTGLRFYHSKALNLFESAGVEITDDNLVRIPPERVEWALETAPKRVAIYNREGDLAMVLGGDRSYFGVGSDCRYIYDLDTGHRREALLSDVVDGVRLVDALPNLDFVMSMFLPTDAPEETYERYQMEIMLTESIKPIVFVGLAQSSTVDSLEMAAAVAGGFAHLADRPFVINYVNPTSAFKHDKEAVGRLLFAAKRNMPTIYFPGLSRGMTAPMTVAGAMALSNAAQLAGLVLSQLRCEGAPFIRSAAGGGTLDMRTMVGSYAAPDGGPYGWDMAHHYDMPIFGTGGCSDAKVFDAQAATEAALSLFANAVSGANLIHDIGYLDCAMTGSLELVALCNEIVGWLRRYLRGPLEITEETLALDLIHEVGPDGSFIESRHTLRHCRDDWVPTLFDRRDYRTWAAAGSSTLYQRANKLVWEMLATHEPRPLPTASESRIKIIVQRANAAIRRMR